MNYENAIEMEWHFANVWYSPLRATIITNRLNIYRYLMAKSPSNAYMIFPFPFRNLSQSISGCVSAVKQFRSRLHNHIVEFASEMHAGKFPISINDLRRRNTGKNPSVYINCGGNEDMTYVSIWEEITRSDSWSRNTFYEIYYHIATY